MRLRSSLLILALGCVVIVFLTHTQTDTPRRTFTESAPTPDTEAPDVRRVASRSWAKDAICNEVRTKRLSLLEAAAVFGWFNQQPPTYAANSFRMYNIHIDHKLLASARESEVALLCLQVFFRIQVQDGPEAETTLDVKEQYLQLCQTGWDIPLPRVVESDCLELLMRAAVANDRGRWGRCDPKGMVSMEGLSLVERSHR